MQKIARKNECMNVHLPDENTMINKSCVDMWESVNVFFYLAALERKKKKEKNKQRSAATVSSAC